MSTDNGYSEVLHCSKLNKKIILEDIKRMFLNGYPELEGTNITQNQLITYMVIYFIGRENYDYLKSDFKS